MLKEWFTCFKCTSSDKSLAQGCVDPNTQETLFTFKTKDAKDRAKESAQYLQDPKPIQELYIIRPPSQTSKHQLPEYLSKCGESKLESFHNNLAHFTNSGMRALLVDVINLAGTARYNLGI